jgi:hypothetical protein
MAGGGHPGSGLSDERGHLMTNDDWQQAIYAALGIPVAVVNKAYMATELLERRFPPAAGVARDPERMGRRAAARTAVLADLAKSLEGGALDRLLVDLEDIEQVATRVAGQIGEGRDAWDVRERKAILQYVLSGLLALTKGAPDRARLQLPAALRPYLAPDR